MDHTYLGQNMAIRMTLAVCILTFCRNFITSRHGEIQTRDPDTAGPQHPSDSAPMLELKENSCHIWIHIQHSDTS